jgi:uncharacterized membrane protein YeiB
MSEDETMTPDATTDRAPTTRHADRPSVADIPHACAATATLASPPSSHPVELAAGPGRPRVVGVDAARGIALFGMMAVHLLSGETAAGDATLSWQLAAGKSAALFAVLAGVGIAFSTGGRQPRQGPQRTAAATSLTVRALLIGVLGLALGSIVPFDSAGVILVYYAALFLLAIPLLGLQVRALVALGVVTATAIPVLSHVVRDDMAAPVSSNPTFTDLLTGPGAFVADLTLTGTFPALTWLAYICVGLAIGRSPLSSRRFVLGMTAAGTALAASASAVSWFLLSRMGGEARLAEIALQTMSRDEFEGLLALGAEGTLPTTSPWWLAVRAPHTGTPVELFHTIGVAMAVIGVAIILGWILRSAVRPLADVGSMPLTLYTMHLLLLVSPLGPTSELAWLAMQTVILVGFAIVWRQRFGRGPLEQVLWRVTSHVRDAGLKKGVSA